MNMLVVLGYFMTFSIFRCIDVRCGQICDDTWTQNSSCCKILTSKLKNIFTKNIFAQFTPVVSSSSPPQKSIPSHCGHPRAWSLSPNYHTIPSRDNLPKKSNLPIMLFNLLTGCLWKCGIPLKWQSFLGKWWSTMINYEKLGVSHGFTRNVNRQNHQDIIELVTLDWFTLRRRLKHASPAGVSLKSSGKIEKSSKCWLIIIKFPFTILILGCISLFSDTPN